MYSHNDVGSRGQNDGPGLIEPVTGDVKITVATGLASFKAVETEVSAGDR
jgi:hypothetical protein